MLPRVARELPPKSDLKFENLNFRVGRMIAKFGENSNGIRETAMRMPGRRRTVNFWRVFLGVPRLRRSYLLSNNWLRE